MTMQLNTQKKIDRFAARIAVRLDSGDLPPGIGERLRQARQHALRQALRPAPEAVPAPVYAPAFIAAHTARAGNSSETDEADPFEAFDAPGDPRNAWRHTLAWLLPLMALALMLSALAALQPPGGPSPARLAAVDAALVADALPPKAYADPGFLQFLRLTQSAPESH